MDNIIIYDNNPLILAGLENYLTQQNFKVYGSTSDSDDFLRIIMLLQPAIIILDPKSMKERCLVRLSELNKILIDMKIIIFADSESTCHVMRSYGLYTMLYLSKKQPIEKLTLLLRQLINKSVYIVEAAGEISDISQKALLCLKKLTDREMQVLREIGAGKTNKTIAGEMKLSNKTISTYKRNIMKKLNTRDVRDVVDFARHHGF
ncbi:response regulator transcription factor [Pantoea trifolii]|jgi:DNA-binding NarL/FixJ family response regulator|uniref:response regulator transcription factor n=1 Tax=Candidatus Pantoea symbiotica TaxID=1884370 RepID=UPI00077B92DB|nr:response regulator transcription factor [Pantoea rodasii]MDY0927292.1 response regulator transcription factor [Enterobacter sp. CFBP8995]